MPACTSRTQTGCVVAYSSFNTTPPANSRFGGPGTALAARSGLTSSATAGLQVLCTNPADLAAGMAPLDPYFLTGGSATSVATPWVAFPGRYTGTCTTADGATWLQVDTVQTPGDTRPVFTPTLGPAWGLHLVDVNIALGDLVSLVGSEAAAYVG